MALLLKYVIMVAVIITVNEGCLMWIGIVVVGYAIGMTLLIRFFQTVHRWDDEIEALENRSKHTRKRRECPFSTVDVMIITLLVTFGLSGDLQCQLQEK